MAAGPRLCVVWGLSDDDSACLLSDEQDDLSERVGALVGIHVALMVIFSGDTARVQKWLLAPNQAPAMGGRSALVTMVEGGLPAMVRLRRYLEAEAAG